MNESNFLIIQEMTAVLSIEQLQALQNFTIFFRVCFVIYQLGNFLKANIEKSSLMTL